MLYNANANKSLSIYYKYYGNQMHYGGMVLVRL